jgi:hypothetical protein
VRLHARGPAAVRQLLQRPLAQGDDSTSVGEAVRPAAADLGINADGRSFEGLVDRPFDDQDAQLVRQASAALGRGLRRATVGLRDDAPAAPLETGGLVIGADLRPRGGTPAVYAWFRTLNPARTPACSSAWPSGIQPCRWFAAT